MRIPLSIRFWRHVQKGAPRECWLWTGVTDKDGYGLIRDDDHRQVGAHRAAWAMANGVPIPPTDVLILHECDTPACVNDAHLFDGTHAENSADKVKKGRQAQIVHQAAPPQDLVQKCSLCGEVLIDRRNQMVMDGYELRWYEGGVEKGGVYTVSTDDPPNCSRRIG